MKNLQESSKDIIDRENRVLRDATSSLESQLQVAKQENSSLSHRLDKAREDLFLIQTAKDNDISMLRADCKLSGYNLSATSANYEEKCAQLRNVTMQLEQSREECFSLRAAVQQFEAKMCQVGRGLKSCFHCTHYVGN